MGGDLQTSHRSIAKEYELIAWKSVNIVRTPYHRTWNLLRLKGIYSKPFTSPISNRVEGFAPMKVAKVKLKFKKKKKN